MGELICAFSGQACVEPVFDTKTQKIFNLPSIQPLLGSQPGVVPASADSLIPVSAAQNSVSRNTPLVPEATNLPSMLSLFQKEWDTVLLQLNMQSQKVRDLSMQLSTSLYENDAAKRVIARLIKERDDALANVVSEVTTTTAKSSGKKRAAAPAPKSPKKAKTDDMDVDQAPPATVLSEQVVKIIDETAESLSAVRRKRKAPASLATPETISAFTVAHKLSTSHAGGSPSSKNGGIIVFSCLKASILEKEEELTLLAGGSKDGKITVRQLDADGVSSTQICTQKAHKKDVSAIAWVSDGTLLTGGVDGKVKTWSASLNNKGVPTWKETAAISMDSPIQSISVHPSQKFYLVCTDASFQVIDIESGSALSTKESKDKEFSIARFHPDGVIFAVGSSGNASISIYDVKSMTPVSKFVSASAPADAAVTSIEFSENGYTMAATSSDSSIMIWDLRREGDAALVKTITPMEEGAGGVQVAWDSFGSYLLAFGHGTGVKVYKNKKWDDAVLDLDMGVRGLGAAWLDDAAGVLVAASDGKYAVLK